MVVVTSSPKWLGMTTRAAAVAALAGLVSACQTSGANGIFGDALPASETTQPVTGTDPAAGGEGVQNGDQVATAVPRPGDNPNARTRLKNTRTALSDYCPAVRIRAGTESYRILPDGAEQNDAASIRYQATITKVARECAYVGNDLQIKVGARGRVITGPKGQPGDVSMPIRVAVTEGGETIYSKLHRPTTSIPQGATNNRFSFVDGEVVIPAPKRTNVRIYIGFDEGPYNTP